MGYWLNPGQTYPDGCGGNTTLTSAQNKTLTSPYWLTKHINIEDNVISVTTTYFVPNAHAAGTFEALTGYLPWNFSQSYYFNPATGTRKETGQDLGEQQYPVIHVDPNGGDAIGIFSQDLPQNWFGANVGYGRFQYSWEKVHKFNCVFRETDIKANSHYQYTCMVIVGKEAEVQATLSRLYRKYHQ
jgi:hypothetical protein